MKMKKLLFSALATTFVLGVGYTSASAAALEDAGYTVSPTALEVAESEVITPYYVPVEAGFGQARETLNNTSSVNHSKKLNWGGGATATYQVSYNDGIVTRDFAANYYSTSLNTQYSLGPYTQYTWDNTLRVSNGSTATATGYVKLVR
ncbi:hypothetical protein [Lysinibacillus fusiformis]|uniref:hypothetical protein n=2 Tax=Lysinibacillus fusiformis TaxID=28031 RepID=UPI00187E0A75|nr:hypothetical protein [Lysinibacillus fusiformis]MBD8520506.1 hypothetical protein [Lysinibacillus fusiformis]MED4887481.1 hypothetical protein [Lysinibacillus fusiformis]